MINHTLTGVHCIGVHYRCSWAMLVNQRNGPEGWKARALAAAASTHECTLTRLFLLHGITRVKDCVQATRCSLANNALANFIDILSASCVCT